MNNKQIKLGSIISYFTIFLNIILGLIYTPWILHQIGSSNYGLYTLASSLIAMFLLDFGMSAAVSRFISNFRAQNNFSGVNAFIGLAIQFYAVVCFILSIIMIFIYCNIGKIYSSLTIDEMQVFRIVFIITAFFVIICFPVNLANGVLNAFEQYIWLKGADVVNKIGVVIVTMVALLSGGGIYTLVFINGICNLLSFIFKCIIIKYKTPVCPSFRTKEEVSFAQILSFSTWTTVSTISQQMIFNMIPSILAIVVDTMAVTLYGFANVIEGYVYTITEAINGLFMPSVSRLIINDDDAKNVLPLMIKVGRINQSIVSLLLIGLTVLGREFVRLWVGEEFSALFYCIMFLSLPYLISASQQIANTSVVVMNKIKFSAIINLITGLINLGASYFVAQRYGVIGVCLVTCIVFLLRTICLNVIYKYVLKIDIVIFFKECHLKMLPGLILSFAISYVAVKFIPLNEDGMIGWIYLGIKSVIISCIYCVIMWMLVWNPFEKNLISSLIHFRKKGANE